MTAWTEPRDTGPPGSAVRRSDASDVVEPFRQIRIGAFRQANEPPPPILGIPLAADQLQGLHRVEVTERRRRRSSRGQTQRTDAHVATQTGLNEKIEEHVKSRLPQDLRRQKSVTQGTLPKKPLGLSRSGLLNGTFQRSGFDPFRPGRSGSYADGTFDENEDRA